MDNSPGYVPTAVLFSELDELSFAICKKLIEEKCSVKIVCKNEKAWRTAVKNEEIGGVEISDKSQLKNVSTCHYIIYHLNYFKLDNKNDKRFFDEETKNLHLALGMSSENRAKSIILLPAEKMARLMLDKYRERFRETSLSTANTVYFKETIGPYYQPPEEGFFGKMAKGATKRKAVVDVRTKGSAPLCSAASSAALTVKLLFSFSRGQEEQITGPGFSSDAFIQILLAQNPTIILRETRNLPEQEVLVKETILVEGPSIQEIGSALAPEKTPANKIKGDNIRLEQTKKEILYFVFSICLFLVLPYLLLFASAGLLFGAGIIGLKQNLDSAERLITVSQGAATSSGRAFSLLIKLPIGKIVFGPGLFASNFLDKAGNTGLHAITLSRGLEEIFGKLFSEDPYDTRAVSERTYLELDFIYRELGFLQGEIKSIEQKLPAVVDKNKILQQLSLAREKISFAKTLAKELPWMLGDDQKRVYILLFQNNMELRPTGGFIGSFAIISVEKGRIVDIDIQDVYTADGQLKGHVEPPEPIKKYLGEAGWFLRDSNWDPEFSVSAQRAEWFLDKELGLKIDGVVSFDLEAAKKLLDVVGEVEVVDYSKTISSKNLYEETRKQIEGNYFPGSRVKANFLAAIASSLLNEISDPEKVDKVRLTEAIVSALEERNVQLFLHNGPALKTLESLGWTGGLPGDVCQNPCYGDWLGLAEANVGVNKANYFIERKAKLSVLLKDGEIKRTITITWKNKADKEAGEKAVYKTYLRVLVPRGDFGEGQKKVGQNIFTFSPDIGAVRGHIEAGTIVEVYPQESSAVSFSWTSPAEIPGEKGEYSLIIRKQAGTVADRWDIEIQNQLGRRIEISPGASLTGMNTFGYNTDLARDFVSRIYW